MLKPAVLLAILACVLSPAARAELVITCQAQDALKRAGMLSYSIDTKTIAVRSRSADPWTTVFGEGIACGRSVPTYVCTHAAHDNFGDPSYPNKSATDSISCHREGDDSVVTSGSFDAMFSGAATGRFFCDVGGAAGYDLALSNCAYQVTE